ncbi:DUF3822 family protein [Cognataquiflexum rubidum]|uniref:DUF3822 family protein n=1 Tax=Cognataquiflexum rubidum TaxID=2922273 RepID=UPI001F130C65|nr:DUF3822 family protein [Cognataquiflexum rubidum]MCH6234177.1 DUF3822 family protein [Cognataquiflexum rubidum]
MASQTENNTLQKIQCDKFDIHAVSNLSLFLFDGFYFYYAKDQNGKILAIHSQSYESPRLLAFKLKDEKLLKLDIPIRVFNHASPFSLVPGMLFESPLSPIFLFFAEKPKENMHVFDTTLASNNLHLVGSIRKELAELLSEDKSDITFHHGGSSFLSFALKEKFNLLNQEVMVLIQKGFFYLIAFTNQELTLFNKFEIENKEDFLKYTLGMIHQLNFNRMFCRISVFGDTSFYRIEEEWGNLYFKNFRISIPFSNIQYQEGTEVFQKPEIFESFWVLP